MLGRVRVCVSQRDGVSVVCPEVGRLHFVVSQSVGNYLRGKGCAESRRLCFSSTPPCAVSHLPETWYGRARKHWVSAGRNAVSSKDAMLCEVEWHKVISVFV